MREKVNHPASMLLILILAICVLTFVGVVVPMLYRSSPWLALGVSKLALLATFLLLSIGLPLFRRARDREEKLRTILESTVDGIITIDHLGQVESFNPAAERMFGYRRSEVIGKNIKLLMPEPYHKEHDGYLRNYMETGDPKIIGIGRKVEGRRKDGSCFPIDLAVSEAHANGRRFFTGVVRDITERLKAEEKNTKLQAQLHHAQRLETVGTLAGGIAHDFNNILLAVFGYAEMARYNLNGPKAAKHLEELLKAAERARTLVRQILTFSQQGEQKREPVKIQEIVNDALNLLRASLPSTVEIHEQIDQQCQPTLADPSQIHQIVMNLGTNAALAMADGGRLEVRLDQVEGIDSVRTSSSADPFVRLTVKDTGQGMDSETLKRIFEPFFTTRGAQEGTGLGLSVVHGIVTSHGGIITVDSEPGVGSTFKVYIPQTNSQAIAKDTWEQPISGGHEHILYVDDEEQLLDMGQQMLTQLGYKVTTATDGEEALEIFRARPNGFDLVMTDQTMPRMTGSELADQVLSIRPTLPIILMTGNEISLKPKAGIEKILYKPFKIRDLSSTLRTIFDRHQQDL